MMELREQMYLGTMGSIHVCACAYACTNESVNALRRVCVCVSARVHACGCVYMHCMCMYVCVYVQMRLCAPMYVLFIFLPLQVCMYLHLVCDTLRHTRLCLCICTNVCMYVCMYVCMKYLCSVPYMCMCVSLFGSRCHGAHEIAS